MKKKNLLFFLLFIIFLMVPIFIVIYNNTSSQNLKTDDLNISSNGNIYWVEAGINGDGTSESNPAGNITHILTNFGSDDMIIKVKSGIYNDSIETFPLDFNFGENVTLESVDGAETTIINASDSSNAIYINQDEIKINGFTIANASNNNGIRVDNVENLTIINNIIRENYKGMNIIGCNHSIISHNEIILNGDEGILMQLTYDTLFEFNEIESNNRFGIHMIYFSPTSTGCTQNTIRSCKIEDHNNDGIILDQSNSNTIINNSLIDNGNIGIYLDESNHTIVRENIISNHTRYGIYVLRSKENDIIRNNISHNGDSINRFGINLRPGSINNSIYLNNFFGNNQDVNCSSLNYFNSTIIGNHWEDYSGNDTNDDKIGDSPHKVDPNQFYYDYLPSIKPIDIRDTTAPILTLLNPGLGGVEKSHFSADWDVDEMENINHYEVRLDLKEWNYTDESIFDFYDVSSGDHFIEIRAVDNGWNIAAVNSNFEVDTTPPNITIISPTNKTYYTRKIYINTTVTDSQSSIFTVIAEVNGVENITLSLDWYDSYIYHYTNFTIGTHSVKIYAIDGTDNIAVSDIIYFTVKESPEIDGIPGFDVFLVLLSISSMSIITIWWLKRKQLK